MPPIVGRLRQEVGLCDGLLIASSEYAHGIAGALKNSLDWLVGSVEFPGKPVALVNVSPRASLAYGQLNEVLRTMSARVVEPACVALPLTGRALDADCIANEPDLAAALRRCVQRLSEAARVIQSDRELTTV